MEQGDLLFGFSKHELGGGEGGAYCEEGLISLN